MSVKQLLTANELWEKPEVPGKRFELVRGQLVEVPGAGMLHNLIAALVYEIIRDFVRAHGIGFVFTDGLGYILDRNPDLVRIPDVSFVSHGRMPTEGIIDGYSPVPPDLAVEVVSPNDRANDVHDKVREYLQAGTAMVLILWPARCSATLYEPEDLARELGPGDDFDGGDVLPGFRVRVTELFEVQRAGN